MVKVCLTHTPPTYTTPHTHLFTQHSHIHMHHIHTAHTHIYTIPYSPAIGNVIGLLLVTHPLMPHVLNCKGLEVRHAPNPSPCSLFVLIRCHLLGYCPSQVQHHALDQLRSTRSCVSVIRGVWSCVSVVGGKVWSCLISIHV